MLLPRPGQMPGLFSVAVVVNWCMYSTMYVNICFIKDTVINLQFLTY